jgi:hypothetical protein
MPPAAVMGSDDAGARIAKQAMEEIVRKSVMTPLDEHYLVVVLHKGISEELRHLRFSDIARLLSSPTTKVHAYIAEHMVGGSAPGGCKSCNGASRELKRLIFEESKKNHGDDSFSIFATSRSRSVAREEEYGTEAGFPLK